MHSHRQALHCCFPSHSIPINHIHIVIVISATKFLFEGISMRTIFNGHFCHIYHYFVSPPTSWGNAPRTASGRCLTIFPNTSTMIIPHVNTYDASLNMCNTQHLQPLIMMHHGHAHHHHWRNTSVRCTHILSRHAPLSSCTTRGWFMFILLGQYSYFRAERGKMHSMYVHQCIALQWCIILSTNKLEELIGEKESIRNNSIWGWTPVRLYLVFSIIKQKLNLTRLKSKCQDYHLGDEVRVEWVWED